MLDREEILARIPFSMNDNHDIMDIYLKNTQHLQSSKGHVRPALTVHPTLCYSPILSTASPIRARCI